MRSIVDNIVNLLLGRGQHSGQTLATRPRQQAQHSQGARGRVEGGGRREMWKDPPTVGRGTRQDIQESDDSGAETEEEDE